jgi:hypothetical protein
MDKATIDIILKAKDEGLDAIKDMRDALKDLQRQAMETNAILGVMALTGFATQNATQAIADTIGKLGPANQAAAQATQATTAAAGPLAAAMAFLGANIAAVLIGLGVLALLLVGPLVLALVGAIVLTAAFAAGVAAVAGSLALAFLPLAALSFGVVTLADRLGLVNGPMTNLKDSLADMADKWGAKAAPMAAQIINWLDSLVPKVQAAGLALLDWFGQRLPVVMQIASQTVNTLMGAFQAWGTVVGKFIDTLAGIGPGATNLLPQLQSMFAMMLNVGVQALAGLLDNMVRLSDWFLQRLPQLGPIVGSIFGAMGSAIQEVAKKAGELVDWFIRNWPEISKQAGQVWSVLGPILGNIIKAAGDAVDWFVKNWPKIRDVAIWVWDQIVAGWNVLAPILKAELPIALAIIAASLDYLSKHTDLVRDILILFGATLAAVAILIVFLAAVIAGILVVLSWLYDRMGNVQDAFDRGQRAANNFLITLGRYTGDEMLRPLGGIDRVGKAFDAIAGPISRAVGWLMTFLVWWAKLPGGPAGAAAQAQAAAASVSVGVGGTFTGGTFTAQHGGMIPGLPGAPVVIQAHAGEVVLSPNLLEAMVGLLQQIAANTSSGWAMSTTAYGRP